MKIKILSELIILTLLSLLLLAIKPIQACDPWCTTYGHAWGCLGNDCTGCHGYGGGSWFLGVCIGGSGNKVCRLGAFNPCTWNWCPPTPCTQCNGGIDIAACGMDTNKCPSSCSDGAPCEIKGGNCCDWGTTGKWDNSDGKCMKCNGKTESLIYADKSNIYTSNNGDTGAITGDTKCESGCGAVSACDEITPNTNGCSNDCTTSTTTSTSTSTTTSTSTISTTSTSTSTTTSTVSTTSTTSTTSTSTTTTTTISTTTTIIPCPYPASYPSNYWDRVWCDMSFTSKLADAPDEGNTQFDNSWGAGILAAGRADNIGFRSGRTISLPSTGTYTFTIGSDDGVRVWIDGNSVLDKWIDKGYSTDTFTKSLNAGNHQFRIDYYENTGDARVSFSYTNPSSTTTTISSTTSTTTTSTTTSTSTTTTISITNIQCSGSTTYDCNAPHDSIESIDNIIVPSYPLNCGNNVNIAVQWTGYHYGDANHWGLFIEDHGQYIPVGNCISYVDGDSPHTKYNMSCYVNIPQAGDINDGTYNLWVTGSDAGGYCNPWDYGTHDEKYTSITLTGCGNTLPCSNCPKRVTPDECKVTCNNVGEPPSTWQITKCKCLSSKEWYYFEPTSPNFEVWINVTPRSDVDVDLYATKFSKACPFDNCPSQIGNYTSTNRVQGVAELIHFTLGEQDSPQYFLVNKISGAYNPGNGYDINLTCKPDPTYTGSTLQGMLQDVPPPPKTNNTYYKITNPVPGRTVIVTLTLQPSYPGNDYSLYCSKAPNLFPFLGTTKPYVYYSNNAGYGGTERCSFTVPTSGTYYYLVHHVRGGYGYNIRWDYQSSTTSTIGQGGGGGGGRMPLMIGVTEVLNNPIVILVALIAIVVIIYGAFKFFIKRK